MHNPSRSQLLRRPRVPRMLYESCGGFLSGLLLAGTYVTGVNQGWNAGLDIAYSGTIGTALEGVMNGIPAIAFSAREFCDPGAMEVYLPRVLQELLQVLPKPGTLWNVNFPDCAASACKGILRGRVPAACSFYDNEYDRAEGALSIRVSNPGPEQCREGSDIHAILHGYVSIGEVRSPLFPYSSSSTT